MMRDIHLHGHLASFVGPQIALECETAGEAVRAIGFQCPKFLDALAQGHYVVIRGDTLAKGISLDLEQIVDFKLGNSAVHFLPVAEGSGGGSSERTGAWIKIIAGAAIVGASIFLSGGVLTTSVGFMGLTYGNLAFIGLTLALLGASKLLSEPDDKKEKESYSITGPMNTYTQGGPVPVVYGEVMTGSVTISSGTELGDINTTTMDVMWLVDCSGSFDAAYWMPNIRNLANSIFTTYGTDVRQGYASFIDFPYSPYGNANDYVYQLSAPLKPIEEANTSSWSLFSRYGGDMPEAQLDGIYSLANDSAVGWGPGIKIIVVYTDVYPHEGTPHMTKATLESWLASNGFYVIYAGYNYAVSPGEAVPTINEANILAAVARGVSHFS